MVKKAINDELEKYKQSLAELELKYQDLLKYKQEIESIFSQLNALVFIIDKDGNYLEIAPSCPENLLIMPREELIGKNVKEIFPAGRAEFFMNHILEALEKKQSFTTEYNLPIQNRNVWFESRVIPIFEEDKEPTKVISIIRDITKWRR